MTRRDERERNFPTWVSGGRLSALLVLASGFLGQGCGDGEPPASSVVEGVGSGGPGTGGPGTGGLGEGNDDIVVGAVGGSATGTGGGSGLPEIMIVETLPAGFVGADEYGGWNVVGPVETVDLTANTECANILRVIARDFPSSHPDFQQEEVSGLHEGIVLPAIGEDRKPLLADPLDEDDLIQDELSFNQWYRNVEGQNLAFVLDLWLEPVGGTFVFDSSSFFPLDEVGYALQPSDNDRDGQSEGFHFTTELHTRFEYKGGETFTFRGDDDVWVYINGMLAIDIGGVHGALEASIDVDAVAATFGMTIGGVYTLDLFQAERRMGASNFRIETTLDFTECGEILPADIPVK